MWIHYNLKLLRYHHKHSKLNHLQHIYRPGPAHPSNSYILSLLTPYHYAIVVVLFSYKIAHIMQLVALTSIHSTAFWIAKGRFENDKLSVSNLEKFVCQKAYASEIHLKQTPDWRTFWLLKLNRSTQHVTPSRLFLSLATLYMLTSSFFGNAAYFPQIYVHSVVRFYWRWSSSMSHLWPWARHYLFFNSATSHAKLALNW